ncbi:MAG: protein kinase [Burkholderiaceae bacterium]|nr:protein kinase [Burkholderiaceae bacterium]
MNTSDSVRKGSTRTLPAGDRIEEFEILRVIGEGGFGIVYLARDHLLHRDVALKEYMPVSFAERGESRLVSVASPRHEEAFEAGRRSFINEARLLAQFDHPALVRVHRFWEANGTAYMVMPYYRAPTLREVILSGGPRPEAWLRAWLAPMLEALQVLHDQGIYHRDIAPDNVLMLDGERPVLLDFGAARQVIGDATQNLTVILKPGYAPIEQYAFGEGARQGPWTDLYALAAVTRYCATGKAPPPAVSRILNDEMRPLAELSAHPLSAQFSSAIDRALSVHADDRPASVAQFRESLGPVLPIPATPAQAEDERYAATVMPSGRTIGIQPRAALPPEGPSPIEPVPRSGGSADTRALQAALTGASPAPVAAARTGPNRAPLIAAAGALALLVTAGGAHFLRGDPPTPSVAVSAASAPAPGAPAPGAAGGTDAAPRPLDLSTVIKGLLSGADPGWRVALAVEQTVLKIGQDKLAFSVTSSLPGYLHVLMIDAEGRRLRQIFPNSIDAEHRVEGGAALALPRPGWSLAASGPPGVAHLLVVVAPSPRDFSVVGLAHPSQGGGFDAARAAQAWATRGGRAFAGLPVDCQFATATCDAYGVAVIALEEQAR